jgi:hypothetical protein
VGTQSGGIPFEYVVWSRINILTIDLGSNDPDHVANTTFTTIPSIDGDDSPVDESTDNDDVPDLSLFDPITAATLADDWVMISSSALQDDVALGSLRLRLGSGYNYVSTIPSMSSTVVYPLCNEDASVLTTSSPMLPEYIQLTTSSWSYPDALSFNVTYIDSTITNPDDGNTTIVSTPMSFEDSISITSWLPQIDTAFAKLKWLTQQSSVELAARDPVMDIQYHCAYHLIIH